MITRRESSLLDQLPFTRDICAGGILRALAGVKARVTRSVRHPLQLRSMRRPGHTDGET
jgi:hypothetical protein